MQVEDGWQAFFVDGTYELRPTNGEEASAHLSTFDREPTPPKPSEAEELLNDLMESASAPSGSVGRGVDMGDGLQRAVARFPVNGDFEGEAIAFVVVADAWAVGATCLAPTGSTAIDQAERMFATISAVSKRKGLFRRR